MGGKVLWVKFTSRAVWSKGSLTSCGGLTNYGLTTLCYTAFRKPVCGSTLQSKFGIIVRGQLTTGKCCHIRFAKSRFGGESAMSTSVYQTARWGRCEATVHQIVAKCCNQPDSWIDWWFSLRFFLSCFFIGFCLSKWTRSQSGCSAMLLCALLHMISRVWWHLTSSHSLHAYTHFAHTCIK